MSVDNNGGLYHEVLFPGEALDGDSMADLRPQDDADPLHNLLYQLQVAARGVIGSEAKMLTTQRESDLATIIQEGLELDSRVAAEGQAYDGRFAEQLAAAKQAKSDLVTAYLPYAARFALEWMRNKQEPGDPEDYIQTAIEGMIRAAGSFLPSKTRFYRYAVWGMQLQLKKHDASREAGWKLSDETYNDYETIVVGEDPQAASSPVRVLHSRNDGMGMRPGYDPHQVLLGREIVLLGSVTLEAPEEEDITTGEAVVLSLADIVADPAELPASITERNELIGIVSKILVKKLTATQRGYLVKVYGFDGDNGQAGAQVAMQLGVTGNRVNNSNRVSLERIYNAIVCGVYSDVPREQRLAGPDVPTDGRQLPPTVDGATNIKLDRVSASKK